MLTEPTAAALGIDLPIVRVRGVAQNPLVLGLPAQFDGSINNVDTDNLRVAEEGSGLVNLVYVSGNGARTGRIITLAEGDIGDKQKGTVNVRGLTRMWVSGTGSSGDAISVGGSANGNRIVGISLESWSGHSLIEALFDGVSGFGVLLMGAQEDFPVVDITSPEDGAEYEEGAEITFTATATDATDGDVSASLDWTSDVDGTIATNDASFTKDNLSLGRHLITATAQDSGLNEGSDSIVITIIPAGGGNQHDDPGGSGGGIGVDPIPVE